MKPTLGLFLTYLTVIAAGLIGYTAVGFARGGDDTAALDTVALFAQALEKEDGPGACELLTPEARKQLARDRGKACEQGIVEIADELAPRGAAGFVRSADTSAIVETNEGDALFLDKGPDGWRIGAAGCEPVVGQPYDCELES